MKVKLIIIYIFFLFLLLYNYYVLIFPFSLILILSIVLIIVTYSYNNYKLQDLLNPLSFIVIVYLVRTFLPQFLLVFGIQPEVLIVDNDDWFSNIYYQKGFILFLIGLTSFILGWSLNTIYPRVKTSNVNFFEISRTLLYSGLFFFMIGLLLWLYYFVINFGSVNQIIWALTSGMLRSGEIQMEGTTRYSYLASNLLNWSSLLLAITLFNKTKKHSIALVPPLIVFFLKIPFGGRVVALTPLMLSLLAIYYIKKQNSNKKQSLRSSIFKPINAISYLFVSLFVASVLLAFRSKGGLPALLESISLSHFYSYLKMSVWHELGFISPFSYAIKIGEGTYDVPLSKLFFAGYTGYFLNLNDVNSLGGMIVNKIVGSGNWGWGIHTGYIVDVFMSFNIYVCMCFSIFFGWITKLVYSVFDPLNNSSIIKLILYCYTFQWLFWIHFESIIGKVSDFYESLIFLLLILFIDFLLKLILKNNVLSKPI